MAFDNLNPKRVSYTKYRPTGFYRVALIYAQAIEFHAYNPYKTFAEARGHLKDKMQGNPQITAGLIFSETTHIVLKRAHILGQR